MQYWRITLRSVHACVRGSRTPFRSKIEQSLDCKINAAGADIWNIYMSFAGWMVRMVKACDRGLENAARGRRPNRRRQHLFFLPAVNWLYWLQMGLFTQLLSFHGLARRLPTICQKSWQRTGNSDSRQKKDVLKNRLFSNYFTLAVFILLIKVSKIVFAVWNSVRSLKFYYKNNFCPSLHAFKINWIGLFYFKLNSRKWENSFCLFQRNSPKYSNDQRGKLDWNWLKSLQRQATNNQTNFHNFKTRHWIYLQWLSFPF